MKVILRLIFLLVIMSASLQAAEAAEAIDEFTLKDQAAWNCARTIAITIFPVDGEFKGLKKQEYYQNYFAARLAEKLRKIPGIETVDLVDGKSPVTADILIDGKFRDLTTGSRALRFWVGLGAGKSFCRAEMNGIATKSGTEIFTLDHARGSAMNIIDEDELIININEVVEDVASGLKKARGTCSPEPAVGKESVSPPSADELPGSSGAR